MTALTPAQTLSTGEPAAARQHPHGRQRSNRFTRQAFNTIAAAAALFAATAATAQEQASSIGASLGISMPGVVLPSGGYYAPTFTVDTGSNYYLDSISLPFLRLAFVFGNPNPANDFEAVLYKSTAGFFPDMSQQVATLSVSTENVRTVATLSTGDLKLSGSPLLEAGETYSILIRSKAGPTTSYLFGVSLAQVDVMSKREGTSWDIPSVVPVQSSSSGNWTLQTSGQVGNISTAVGLGRPMMEINATPTSVPEPGAVALVLGAATLGLAIARRRSGRGA